jgi:hypothetical protein
MLKKNASLHQQRGVSVIGLGGGQLGIVDERLLISAIQS